MVVPAAARAPVDLRDAHLLRTDGRSVHGLVLPWGNMSFWDAQEKVIDREIHFSPDVSAILRLVYDNVPAIASDSALMDEMVRQCAVLELRNIRLIVKTRNYYTDIEHVLREMDATFRRAVLSALQLFVCVKFGRVEEESLTLGFLSSYSELTTIMRAERRRSEDEPSGEHRAAELLKAYGYTFTDDLDVILMRFVTTDVLDEGALRAEHEKYRLECEQRGTGEAIQ